MLTAYEARATVRAILNGSTGTIPEQIAGTAYGLVQGAVEYLDHLPPLAGRGGSAQALPAPVGASEVQVGRDRAGGGDGLIVGSGWLRGRRPWATRCRCTGDTREVEQNGEP